MYVKIQKQKSGAAKVTVNLPVNAVSRAYVDAETARVCRSVIPIIGDKEGRPFLVGSAVAINFRDRKFLVTAYHVIEGSADRPLFYFDVNGHARPFRGNFNFSEPQDLAAIELTERDAEALRHIPFLAENSIGSTAGSDGRFYASVAGYPHTAAKLIDKITIGTPMEVYSNMAHEKIDGFISVIFDKNGGAWVENSHQLVRDPIGKSGGAIFGIPLVGLNDVRTTAAIRLVGIATDWKRDDRCIVGPSSVMLVNLLKHMTV